MTPMVTTKINLQYHSTVGFHTDQGSRGFQHPSAFIMRDDGTIFVASRGAGPTVGVQMVNRDFAFFGKLGEAGGGIGQMQAPSALALDSQDNLYVADEKLNRITIFDKDGKLKGSWGEFGNEPGQFNNPSGMAILDDEVIVTDTMNHRIQRYTTEGKFISQWGEKGSDEGQYVLPWGLSTGHNKELIIADWGNDRIVSSDLNGNIISIINGDKESNNSLNRPAHAAQDLDNNWYVADWGNQLLKVFDQRGNFLERHRGSAGLNPWALEYFESQQDEKKARSTYAPIFKPTTKDVREISALIEPYFWDPCALIIGKDNAIYVLETCRHRFQIYERK